MLICTEAEEDYYVVLDTDNKDIDFEDINKFTKGYTPKQIKKLLRTTKILGLNKDAECFIDEEMMGFGGIFFKLDVFGDTNGKFIGVRNHSRLDVYCRDTSNLFDSIELINYLEVDDIYIDTDENMIYVWYALPSNLYGEGIVFYHIFKSSIALIDSTMEISDDTGAEYSAELPVDKEYAEELLENLGIDAVFSSDLVDVYNNKLCLEYLGKEDYRTYLVAENRIYGYKQDDKQNITIIYRSEEVE
jgi:hypothetical protein